MTRLPAAPQIWIQAGTTMIRLFQLQIMTHLQVCRLRYRVSRCPKPTPPSAKKTMTRSQASWETAIPVSEEATAATFSSSIIRLDSLSSRVCPPFKWTLQPWTLSAELNKNQTAAMKWTFSVNLVHLNPQIPKNKALKTTTCWTFEQNNNHL